MVNEKHSTLKKLQKTSENKRYSKTIPTIFNLSCQTLSMQQIKLLSRGLKFTPKPERNLLSLEEDVKNFTRKLRLMDHFRNGIDSNEDTKSSLIKKKSTFTISKSDNKILEKEILYLENLQLKDLPIAKNKDNLSREERKALKELKDNENIVIKKADKGGATVILDKKHYEEMVYSQLSNGTTYKRLEFNKDKSIHDKLKKFIEKHKECFTKNEEDCLRDSRFTTSCFYGLPKVHKSKIIANAIKSQNTEVISLQKPDDLKLRPIVAGTRCPTRNLSNLLDKALKPLLRHVRSHLRDSIEFLCKCKRRVAKDSKLVSFDVTSLYTSIPHELGIESIRYFLEKFPNTVDQRFTKEFVLEATEFILKNNTFEFNDEYFLQLIGTAMGTIFAPTYATIVMGFLEESLYDRIEDKFGQTFRKEIENNWLRFLDDCFIILENDALKPNEFLNILNELNNDIKFTMEVDSRQLAFLDVMVNIENDKIWMDTYSKPTDTKRYVPFNSCHPKHTLKNIPLNLAQRICMIIEKDDIKEQKLEQLLETLTDLGYPTEVVRNGISRAKKIPQTELRKTKEKKDENILSFVSTNNPSNPNIFNTIRTSIDQVRGSLRLKKVLENTKLIHSKKQPSNLGRLLCKSKYVNKDKLGVRKCGKNCVCCNYLMEIKEYKFLNLNSTFVINSNFNCNSSNLIYAIICPGCNEEYIGQTSRTLKERLILYRQHINHPEYQTAYIEQHLRDCGKGRLLIFPILQVKQNDVIVRETIESKFIAKIKPRLNKRI